MNYFVFFYCTIILPLRTTLYLIYHYRGSRRNIEKDYMRTIEQGKTIKC